MSLERLTEEVALAVELEELASKIGKLRERHPRVGGPRIALAFAEARAALLGVVNELAPAVGLAARR